MEIIQGQSGKHFDPEVVRAFLQIHEVILAIKEKYQEEQDSVFHCHISL
jgi:response regulator RpfG family c-di-GMP phosphodiesterase